MTHLYSTLSLVDPHVTHRWDRLPPTPSVNKQREKSPKAISLNISTHNKTIQTIFGMHKINVDINILSDFQQFCFSNFDGNTTWIFSRMSRWETLRMRVSHRLMREKIQVIFPSKLLNQNFWKSISILILTLILCIPKMVYIVYVWVGIFNDLVFSLFPRYMCLQ